MIYPLLLLLQSTTPYGSPISPILDAPAVRVAPSQTSAEVRFGDCIDLAVDDPPGGIVEANKWRIEGGAFLARHCLGFAHAEQFNWNAATIAFVEAAREAELDQYPRTAGFWAQAGNAALAGGKANKALEYLNAALVQNTLVGLDKGEVHLDLARAHVALSDYAAAQKQFTEVHALAPQDPLGWLLSATLARRMKQFEQAKTDIVAANKLAPGDPAVALEVGNIAYAAGDIVNAKLHWEKTVAMDSESPSARAAKSYLIQLGAAVEPDSPATE